MYFTKDLGFGGANVEYFTRDYGIGSASVLHFTRDRGLGGANVAHFARDRGLGARRWRILRGIMASEERVSRIFTCPRAPQEF